MKAATTGRPRDPSTRRRVLVTGGVSGIGAALVHRFAADGHRLAVLDIDEPGVAEIGRAVPAVELALAGDVADPRSVDAAFAALDQHWGGVDVLFNNAGISIPAGFLDIAIEDWNRVLAVNLTGVFLVAQRAARRMLAGGGGVIVNTASVSGIVGMPGYAAYNATKAGVI